MPIDRTQLRETFPEAFQLFAQFGEDYDYEFNKDERAAIDDYADGNTFVAQALAEIDQLLARFPDNDSMREALFHLGVKWTMWDVGDDWVPFVERVRARLVDSLAAPAATMGEGLRPLADVSAHPPEDDGGP